MGSSRIIARFTVEATAPLMIAGGEDDPILDNSLAKDPNGLPMLPATAIAGALRARVSKDEITKWFGFHEGLNGGRSKLTFTDGLLHWADGKPRDGLNLDRTAMKADAVCKALFDPARPAVLRDHNRLNDKGVVKDDGKFTRSAVPTGARFTFEVRSQDRTAVDAVTALIRAGIWLGGASRAGFGGLKCVAVGCLDLRLDDATDMATYIGLAKADLGGRWPETMDFVDLPDPAAKCWRVEGTIEGPLLIGGESKIDRVARQPYVERRIDWSGEAGKVLENCVVIPGSSIKGPLRHRTFFHLQRGGMAEAEAHDALNEAFGIEVKGNDGRAGALRFHDCRPIGDKTVTVPHVGLDRFSGGARGTVLFTDEMLWRPELKLRIDEIGTLSPDVRVAFRAALEEMKEGVCGLGAEWGEGSGVFRDAKVTEPEGDA